MRFSDQIASILDLLDVCICHIDGVVLRRLGVMWRSTPINM